MTRLAVPVAAVVALVAALHAQPARTALPVPDIAGYVTLKADFHLHSVFSDGEVWPTVHVREAWRDGLDVIALTEHLEYQPHRADVSGGPTRAVEVAQPLSAQLGLLLVPGVEITRPVPGTSSAWPVGSAHFNVLFPTDIAALDTPDLADVLSRARSQGAFVFWNHPGFMGKPATWFPHVAALFDAGLFSGVEVVNGDQFYPEALAWARQRPLTPLSCSDAHLPMPAHLLSARRPITLVFARSRTLGGVKEALVARRTLAWLDRQVWGDESLLGALWAASVAADPVRAVPGADVNIVLRNSSAIPYDVSVVGAPAWLTVGGGIVAAETTTVLKGRLAAGAPSGTQLIRLDVRLDNVRAQADRPLAVTLPVDLAIER